MQFEQVLISSLKFLPKNARKHSERNLNTIAASLKECGQQKPIVVDASNVVIAGNGTLEAATSLGWDKIWVTRTSLDKSRAELFAILDNRTAELAEWDVDELTEALDNLEKDGWELDDFGFSDKEREKIRPKESKPGLTDDDAVPENVETRCKLGDLWELGGHRLLCGDCTDIVQVERLASGQKIKLFVTDPPYGVSYADKNAYLNAISPANRIQVGIKNDHGSIEETGAIWLSAYCNAKLIAEDYASSYIFSPQGGDLMMMMMIEKSGWTLKHMLVWVKNNHVLGRCDYHYKHEPIFYGWNKTHKFYGGSSCFSVIECNKPMKNDLHPTMKPIELIERLVANSSKQGDEVLDLFLGSGSTLIACEKTNRTCYGMEIDPHYCDVIISRWEDFTGKTAKLISAEKSA